MYAEERQQAIARLVTQRGRVSVNQLAQEYDVTTETVRRDLSTLERIGLVRRVHGGVVPPSSLLLIESGIRERDQVNTEVKERIAKRGAGAAPPGGRHDPRRRRLHDDAAGLAPARATTR